MKQTILLLLTILFVMACQQPIPTPEPDPDPIAPPPDPAPAPCEINTTDHGCISLERFNTEKAALIAEYATDTALERHKHHQLARQTEAWSNIRLIHGNDTLPGAGVNVAMIDDGIDLTHPGLDKATVTEYFFDDTTRENTTTYTDPDHIFSHGTTVASHIISNAALPDNYYNFYGVAPGAHLHSFTFERIDGYLQYGQHIVEVFDILDDNNIDILNISLASRKTIDQVDADSAPITPERLEIYKQENRADKIIIVTGTGNNSLPQPAGSAGLPVLFPELKTHYVATVIVDETGEIGELSNYCGLAHETCIAAPVDGASNLYSGLENGAPVHSIYQSKGTSASTAYISGSLALIKQQFRDQLTGQEMVDRLYKTANKTGRYADSSIYGQGLVDLDAATSPVGELRVVLDGMTSASMADSQVLLGAPFGDALSLDLAGREIAAFDGLHAPFFMSLADLYRPRSLSTSAALYRPGFTDPDAPVQFIDNGLGGHSNHLSLAGNVIAANVSHNQFSLRTYASLTQPNEPSIAGADLAWKTPFVPLSLRIGSLFEQGSVLGTRPYGAWGNVNTTISYLSLTGHVIRHGWLLNADLQLGYAVPSLHSAGMIDHISPLVTSAFDISATRKLLDKHHIRLSVSQPLRIESGNATLIVPTGRLKSGSVTMNQLKTDLTPSGRQFDLTARLRGAFRLFNYDLSTAYSLNPIHRSTAPNELRVQFSLQASY